VSLSGALTEVVYLLNAQNLLVGTDTTSLFPRRRKNRQGRLCAPALGRRPALAQARCGDRNQRGRPPVVLDQIRQAGVRVSLVAARHNWAEVQEKVKVVGRETGRSSEADKLLAQLDAQWSSVQAQVAKAQRKPRVLFVLSHSGSPQVAGKGTAANALIQYAGCVNVIDQFDGYKP
jgi:iron complex transport system substrate-binding protein